MAAFRLGQRQDPGGAVVTGDQCTCQLSPMPLDRIEYQALMNLREMRMRRKPGQQGKVVIIQERDGEWRFDIKMSKTVTE